LEGRLDYTSVEYALSSVIGNLRVRPRVEVVPVRQAYGRVSSKDLLAPSDVPPFATSHMDGYAVISSDLKGATASRPTLLAVVGEVGPGARPRQRLTHGEAFQVATGAGLPPGADAVVPKEEAEPRGRTVLMKLPPKPGSHIYGAGEDVRRGQAVISAGQAIRAQDIGVMIALGFQSVGVWKKPKVAVIATGNELTSAGRPKAGKIRESHSPVLLRLADSFGCVPVDVGIVVDDPVALAGALRKALAASDFVVTLGGTSAGKRDHVIGTVSSLGPDVLFHGIKLDRGRVTGIASVGGKPVLMLPGPIQAAMNAFLVLGTPIIQRLSGRRSLGIEVACRMESDWESRKRFSDFKKVVYVKMKLRGEMLAEPLSAETESLMLLAAADGYALVPGNVTRLSAGDLVTVRLLPGFSYAS
jgi:molybdenum cofactor synthesis domain-containing protein